MAQERYQAIDIARTIALAGMVVFHFVYDLDIFGWVPRGTATTGWFWYHARLVAMWVTWICVAAFLGALFATTMTVSPNLDSPSFGTFQE